MNIIIIHRWGGSPQDDWYPWLKQQLEKQGHEVIIPEMPDTNYPKINEWVHVLENLEIDNNTILIGHSIGCLTILHYLEKANTKVKACFFVAGWFNLKPLEDEESEEIAKPWVETPMDFDKIRKNCTKFLALFSDNDPYVPVEEAKLFEQRLGAKTIVEHSKGHYNEAEEPTVLNALLSLIV